VRFYRKPLGAGVNYFTDECFYRIPRKAALRGGSRATPPLGVAIGFTLARFTWRAIALSSPALAVLATVVLHRQGFGPLAGIAIIVACLTINQVAYLAGVSFVDRRSKNLIPACGAGRFHGVRR
jgi:hypothetical protein